jgi:hypothetical protein
MVASKFLSKAIGIYLIIVSIVMELNAPQFMTNVTQLVHNGPLMFVTGFFTLILGIIMVLSHNTWQWSWRVLVTIVCWITLLKGINILVYPELIGSTSVKFLQHPNVVHVSAALDFVLGILFLYFGYRRS